MSAWFKSWAVPVAAAFLMVAGAGVASADPIVGFLATGQFDVGTANSYPGTLVQATSDGAGNSSIGFGDTKLGINTFIDYHAQAVTLDLGQPQYKGRTQRSANVDFGYFTFRSTDPNGSLTKEKYREIDGAQFTLTLTQLLPVVPTGESNQGTFASKLLHGTIWYSEATGGTGAIVKIKFADPLSFTIPHTGSGPDTVTYTVQPYVSIVTDTGGGNQVLGLAGTVSTAVPLPAVAWVGMSLLGGVGGVRGLRRLRGNAGTIA